MRGKILIKNIDAVILLCCAAPLGTRGVSVAVRATMGASRMHRVLAGGGIPITLQVLGDLN
jgi:hypothetical protein